MKKDSFDKTISFLFFLTALFLILSVFFFYGLRNVPEVSMMDRPYDESVLDMVRTVKSIEANINENAFDGTNLRMNIPEMFSAMNITSVSTKSGKGRIIIGDLRGLVRMNDIQELMKQFERKNMSVNSMKLSSRLNFNPSGTSELSDVVFDVSLSISFIKR